MAGVLRRVVRHRTALVLALALSGCGTPSFYSTDAITKGDGASTIEAPDADLVLKQIQCELIDVLLEAKAEHERARQGLGERPRVPMLEFESKFPSYQLALREAVDKLPPLARLMEDDYVAQLTITLEVTQNEGLTPQLSFVTPASILQKRSLGIAGQMSGVQHRTMSESITVDMSLKKDQKACGADYAGSRLRGKLGLDGIVAAGLKSTIGNPMHLLPEGTDWDDEPVAAPLPPAPASAPEKADYVLAPKFGSTIDFTVVYGINATPTWTLSRFLGPSPGSGGLANWVYTVKDTLVISLVSSGKAATSLEPESAQDRAKPSRAQRRAAAGNAAQQNNVQQILMQHIPNLTEP